MIIYNVTIQVDEEIADQWLSWLRQEHIPDVMASGCFVKFQLVKILGTEPESVSYAVQYYSDNQQQLDLYLEKHAMGLRKKASDKWGDRFIAFRTIMELVD